MTERKVKLDRANKSILLRALGDVYYGQRAHGGSTEVTGRLIRTKGFSIAAIRLISSYIIYTWSRFTIGNIPCHRKSR